MHGVPALVPATLKWEKALNGIASPPAVWVQMHACHMFRQRKLHPRNPWVKPPVCMYSPEKNPWGFVFVLTHFSVDTLTGRELRASLLQSPTQNRIVWGPVRWIRAIWAIPSWILKASSDGGCVPSLAACPNAWLSQGKCFHLHPHWGSCVSTCTCSLIPHCAKPASSWWAPVGSSGTPQSHHLLGLSRACWSWLSAEVFPTVQILLPWASSTLFRALCTGGCRKL